MTSLTAILPDPLAEALDTNARKFIETVADLLGDGDEAIFEHDPTSRIEEIPHEPYSGFWPWTSGGYEVCLPASLYSAWSSGSAPGPICPTIASGNAIIADEWNRQYPDKPPFAECIALGEGDLYEEACEWEMEGWQSDDDCYYYKARVIYYAPGDRDNETGEPEVYLDCYLVTDSYGRDNIPWLSCYGTNPDQTRGGFKRTIKVDAFAGLSEGAIEAFARAALRGLPSFESCF